MMLSAIVALSLTGSAVMAQEDDHSGEGEARQLTLDDAPVQSEVMMICRFGTECYEAEACAASGFEADLIGLSGGMSADALVVQAMFRSDAGNVELIGLRAPEAMSLSGGQLEARHLLTVANSGAARYTMHYADGPMVISYLGTCTPKDGASQ
ncbi:hypothetical protein [Pseudoprimorskyibacter insulae]|uniref:Lipoprotein n=1 Tax=Pseudoprimorskyibacter insulae TaxID=1695997 RepID=A0A2R8AZ33_9RHOB|nr:hypothetical protein [Pseudoprimorskyibacter insulae]SPF81292.1 hypothetical protein PRI8871_03114 [Pseudoprimorskyibacter insulae]